MSIDLVGLVKEALTPEAVNKLSNTLGESPVNAYRALEAGVPAILAGMAAKANSGGGLSGLLSIFDSGRVDSKILRDFGPMLNGSRAAEMMDFGRGVVEKVFGDKTESVADAISSQSGVRPSSARSLLELSAPLAIGAISKVTEPQGVTTSSLLNTLSSQRDSITRLLPAGSGSILGGGLALSPAVSPAEAWSSPNPVADSGDGKGLLRFWPLWALLAAVVIAGLIWSLRQDSSPAQATTDATMAAKARTAVPVASNPAWAALGEFSRKRLPNGTEINIPQLGVEYKLINFIEGPLPVDKETWFDFDRLLFETGSATLQPSSQQQLDDVANILKAYPKVHVKIGGYTDNVGNQSSNLTLSGKRARSVMESLVKAGVENSRMASEGYGEIHPVADNATEEGRAKNRRISLRVTVK